MKYISSFYLLIVFTVTVNAQALKIAESKEGQGSYFAKGILLPYANGEILMTTQSLLYTFGDKADATQLSNNLELKGEKLPFQLWGEKGGLTMAKNFFVTDFEKDRTIFSAREYTGKVDFGYSKFNENLLSPPTWKILFTYKINPNSQDAHQFENNYLFGGAISENQQKVGVVYFPDGNKGKTDNASTMNINCYSADGKELWSTSTELPNESRFRIRIIDVKTDNNGNVFAILNYIRFSSPYYISKGQFSIAAGPDFGKLSVKPIEFNRSIITKQKRTWVDQKGGYYIIGSCEESVEGKTGKSLIYYSQLANSGEDKNSLSYLNEKSTSFPSITGFLPEEKNNFPNRILSTMELQGCFVVDDNHTLVLATSKNNSFTAFLMNKEGDVLDKITLLYKGASHLEELKTPHFKKINNTIYLFYQGIEGEKELFDDVKQLPEPPKESDAARYKEWAAGSVFLFSTNITNPVGKYIIFKDNKFERKEYIIEGTEGYGMHSHTIKLKGNDYYFYNRKNAKKDVGYKLIRFE